MRKNKEEAKVGTAQAKVSEDEAVRVGYEHGTPLESGKIAESKPVDLFSSAHNIQKVTTHPPQLPMPDHDHDSGPRTNVASN